VAVIDELNCTFGFLRAAIRIQSFCRVCAARDLRLALVERRKERLAATTVQAQ